MNESKLNLLVEQVEKNILKEAVSASTVTAADSSVYAPLLVPLLKKLYSEALISQIADVQKVDSPAQKVSALFAVYSGFGSSANTNAHPDSSFVLILPNDSPATWDIDGTAINFGSSTFKVRYTEEDETETATPAPIIRVLVSRESGTDVPKAGDTFNTKVITFATQNRASIKKLFKGYSGTVLVDGNGNKEYLGYNQGFDDNTNVKFIGFETRTINTSAITRKLKSRYSQEQLQDMLAVYKEKAEDIFSTAIAHELCQEIDKEFICYLKYISKLLTSTNSPLQLSASYGAAPSGSLQDVSYDLVSNIYLAAEQIVKDTKRNRTIFVLADPVTTSFLQTNAFHVKADPNEKNPYKIGKIGTYPLFCDLYSEPDEFYIMVGYLGVDGEGDAGVIYSPYSYTIHPATDPDNFTENFLYMNRYGMTRHPQDTGNVDWTNPWALANSGNSDFFKIFTVDYSGVVNFGTTSVPNFK